MLGQVMEISSDSFEEDVLESDLPVLVDFWAEWCAPCRMMAPVLEEIGQEMADTLKVVKLNVDENQDTAQQYGIRSIPTLVLFKDGEEAERLVGFMAKEQIVEKLGKI